MPHETFLLLSTQNWVTFLAALTSTAVSEIGDRSMFTASVLAMQHEMWLVFSATFTALLVQSLCSVVAGGLVGKFLQTRGHGIIIKVVAAVLFGLFAIQHYWEAYQDRKDEIRQQRRQTSFLEQSFEGLATDTEAAVSANETGDACYSAGFPTDDHSSASVAHYVSADSQERMPKLNDADQTSRIHEVVPAVAPSSDTRSKIRRQELRHQIFETAVHGNSRRYSWQEDLNRRLSSGVDLGLCSFQPSEDEGSEQGRSPHSLTQYSAHWWKVFALVYLAEIGDTSMLVQMTLASDRNVVVVFLGAMVANAIVNFAGIWAARVTAKHVSDFWVNLCAAFTFTIFTTFSVFETVVLMKQDGAPTALHGSQLIK